MLCGFHRVSRSADSEPHLWSFGRGEAFWFLPCGAELLLRLKPELQVASVRASGLFPTQVGAGRDRFVGHHDLPFLIVTVVCMVKSWFKCIIFQYCSEGLDWGGADLSTEIE